MAVLTPLNVITPLSPWRGVGGEASPLSFGEGLGGEAVGVRLLGGEASISFLLLYR